VEDVRFGRYKPTKKKQISAFAAVDYTAYDVTRSVSYLLRRDETKAGSNVRSK